MLGQRERNNFIFITHAYNFTNLCHQPRHLLH